MLLVEKDGQYTVTFNDDQLLSVQIALAEQFMFFSQAAVDEEISPKIMMKAIEMRELFRVTLLKVAHTEDIVNFVDLITEDPFSVDMEMGIKDE